MRWKNAAIILFCCLSFASPGAAQELPSPGLLFNEVESKRLVEEQRDLETQRALVETMKAQMDAQNRRILELQSQVKGFETASVEQQIALARMDERDKLRKEQVDGLVLVLKETRDTLQQTRDVMKDVADQNKALHKELTISRIFGPLGMIASFAIGYFTFGAMH